MHLVIPIVITVDETLEAMLQWRCLLDLPAAQAADIAKGAPAAVQRNRPKRKGHPKRKGRPHQNRIGPQQT